jgi:chromate reductase
MSPGAATITHGSAASWRVLAVAGSLRRDSFNRRLVEAVAALSPADVSIGVFEGLPDVPLFNEDLESEPPPRGVQRLREAVAQADGLLIATPEYNQALPGVVKNFVDWLSRGDAPVLEGKPVAILGVTPGSWGTRHAQAQLRHCLAACGALVMPAPQVYLRDANQLFGEQGELLDARARESLTGLATSFGHWMRWASGSRERKTS